MKSKYEQNPYPNRGHRHRWKLTKDTPATKGGYVDFWAPISQHRDPTPRRLIRECEDCGVKQTAEVEDESVIVKGYEAVSDCEWKDIV